MIEEVRLSVSFHYVWNGFVQSQVYIHRKEASKVVISNVQTVHGGVTTIKDRADGTKQDRAWVEKTRCGG